MVYNISGGSLSTDGLETRRELLAMEIYSHILHHLNLKALVVLLFSPSFLHLNQLPSTFDVDSSQKISP